MLRRERALSQHNCPAARHTRLHLSRYRHRSPNGEVACLARPPDAHLPARFSLGVRKTSQWPPQLDAQCTEEPEYDQDKQNGAEDAASGGPGRGPSMRRGRARISPPGPKRSPQSSSCRSRACARSMSGACRSTSCTTHRHSRPWNRLSIPRRNARYAARFLISLFHQTADWPKAGALYHSATPEIAADYARRLEAVWPGVKRQGETDAARVPAPTKGC